MNKNFNVTLCPSLDGAKEYAQLGNTAVTVEAEYGNDVINGQILTMAHHGSRSNNPAPCVFNISRGVREQLDKLDTINIQISHIDLDTLGGIMATVGCKPENDKFWTGAAYIDVNGPHHIYDLDVEVQNLLNGWYAAVSKEERKKITCNTDVTEEIKKYFTIIEELLDDSRNASLIEEGKEWSSSISESIEACLVSETEHVGCFITDGVFCPGSYYSPKQKKVLKATVVLNTKFNAITIAFEDGGRSHSAEDIVKRLWGKEAGGRSGIAGSPRNWGISDAQLQSEFERAQKAVKDLYEEFI